MEEIILAISPGLLITLVWIIIVLVITIIGFRVGVNIWKNRHKKDGDGKR
jgi:hypothetical protein